MFFQMLKLRKKYVGKAAFGLSAFLVLLLLVFWLNRNNLFLKDAFLKKTAYRKKIITQTNFYQKNLIVVDTFTQSFDEKKRIIAENDVVFYDYNSAGKLSKIIVCLDKNCNNILVKEPISPEIMQYSLNQTFFQLQSQHTFSRISPKEELEPYIYQKDSLLNSEIRKIKHYFYTDTDTILTICYQHYDSLQRLRKIRFSDKNQNFFFEIHYFYDTTNKLTMKHHRLKSSIHKVYSKYYYHIYEYDLQKRLKRIQTYQMPDSSLHSQTSFDYIEELATP